MKTDSTAPSSKAPPDAARPVPRWISGDTLAPEKPAPLLSRAFELAAQPRTAVLTLAVAGATSTAKSCASRTWSRGGNTPSASTASKSAPGRRTGDWNQPRLSRGDPAAAPGGGGGRHLPPDLGRRADAPRSRDLAALVAAAQMLSDWMDNPRLAPASRSVPAARIVRRASSRVVLDDRVARAFETIRLHACDEGFGPPDVVRAMCLSRAPAFRLFKRIDGRTIMDEIHAVRLERAMTMLVEGRRADAVAEACGYASLADFRRVFKKRVVSATKIVRDA